jgi:hypothetical protein
VDIPGWLQAREAETPFLALFYASAVAANRPFSHNSQPETHFMSTVASTGRAKAAAQVALLGVDDASAGVLTECFHQFGVQVSVVPATDTARLAAGYSACVVPLDSRAEPLLRDIRHAGHNIVLYGICGSIREALPFSQWGVNAVFHTPIHQRDAIQVVRSTHLLLMKELRRYVRVPLVCPLTLETGTEVLEASSLEISAGGMLISTRASLKVPQAVLATFCLPDTQPTSVRSVVCWTRDEDGAAALRFDPGDTRRATVRHWIDEYLGA